MEQGIKEKDIRDFEKAVERLQEVVNRILLYKPEARAFLNNGDNFQIIFDVYKYNKLLEKEHYLEAAELVVGSFPVTGFNINI